MATKITDIIEVVETGAKGANEYLKHGYVLLHADQVARWQDKGESGFVLKFLSYIVGRTADVEKWSRPPRETTAEEAAS